MNNLIGIALSLACGILLGLLYFRALWWTAARMRTAKSPVGFYLASFIVRTTVLLSCLLVLLQFGPAEMLVALAGFFVVRVVMVRCYGFSNGSPGRGFLAAELPAPVVLESPDDEATN